MQHAAEGSVDADALLLLLLLLLLRLAPVVSAAWQLHAKRTWLAGGAPDSLNPLLTQMRVVKEAQLHLHQLAAR
jgi:hypothetical protein